MCSCVCVSLCVRVCVCVCSCWITDQVFAYGMNLTFFSLVFLLNSGILIAVSGRILRLQGRRRGTSSSPSPSATTPGLSCRNLLTVLGLTCLLGSTWGLAFLSLSYANHAILYLFCILNSLQGKDGHRGMCVCVCVCVRMAQGCLCVCVCV